MGDTSRGRIAGSNQKDWKELVQKAANQQDSNKLLAIIQELNQALEERERQLHPKKREGGNELLFVDDEPSVRLTLPPILQEHGFEVQVAATVLQKARAAPRILGSISARPDDPIVSVMIP
jgi:hypothetical protein